MKTEKLILQLLKNIGENPQRPDLLETPARVQKMHEEIFGGYKILPKKIFKNFENCCCDEMVVIKNI